MNECQIYIQVLKKKVATLATVAKCHLVRSLPLLFVLFILLVLLLLSACFLLVFFVFSIVSFFLLLSWHLL